MQFPGSLQVYAYEYSFALTWHGLEGHLQDMADLRDSEAPLALLA